MMHDEDDPSEEELREAEALARALDRGHAPTPPDDALGAAALLRYARRGATLPEARHDAILSEAIQGARRRERPIRRFFLLSALGLSLAAAFALVVSRTTRSEPSLLPAPPTTLLSAQAEAARPGAGNLATLGAEMKPYRDSVYAKLEERYGK
jgi:hypothetical protein